MPLGPVAFVAILRSMLGAGHLLGEIVKLVLAEDGWIMMDLGFFSRAGRTISGWWFTYPS